MSRSARQPARRRISAAAFLPMALMIAVLLWAAYLRVYNVHVWPPGLSHDESLNGLDAFRFLRTGVIPFYVSSGEPEPLYRLWAALTLRVAGPTRFGLRLASFYAGILAVAAAFRAGRHLAPRGSRARWRVGLIAAAILAVMIGHIHLSRVAYRAILQPLTMLLFFDAFIAAWEWRKTRHYALAGLWLGLSLLTYTSALAILPLVVLAFLHRLILWLVDLPASIERGANVKGILAFVGASLLAAAPLLILLAIQPDFYGRADEVSGGSGGLLARLPRQLAVTWRMVAVEGDINPQYNVAQAPLLTSPVLYGLLLAGMAACLLRPRRLAGWLSIGYLGAMLLPVALSDEIPHGLRIAGEYAAIPLVVAASADPVIWLGQRLTRARLGEALQALYALGTSAALILTAFSAQATYTRYMQKDVRWGTDGVMSAFSWFFETRSLALADAIAVEPGVTYLPLDDAAWPNQRYFTLRSHPRAATFATYFGPDGPLTLPAGRVLLPPGSEVDTTFVAFMPDGTVVLLPRFDDGTLAALREAARSGETLHDAYGEVAGVAFDFPAQGDIVIENPVANPIGRVNYDDRFGLIGWDAALELPEAGGEVPVTLYFAPGPQRRREVTLFTQLWTITGERLASAPDEVLLRWLYPVNEWREGDIMPFVSYQPIPPGLTPGAYHVAVGLVDFRGDPVPVLGADGLPVADAAVAGAMKIPRAAPPLSDILPVEAEFGGAIRLLGYEILDAASGSHVDQLAPGQAILVRLYWQTIQRPAENYTIFVHLTDAGGQIIAQNDSQPDGGQYPTAIWTPGEVVRTEHFMILPDDAAGPFTLFAGFYSWPSLVRLPVVQAGQRTPDDRARLGEVE